MPRKPKEGKHSRTRLSKSKSVKSKSGKSKKGTSRKRTTSSRRKTEINSRNKISIKINLFDELKKKISGKLSKYNFITEPPDLIERYNSLFRNPAGWAQYQPTRVITVDLRPIQNADPSILTAQQTLLRQQLDMIREFKAGLARQSLVLGTDPLKKDHELAKFADRTPYEVNQEAEVDVGESVSSVSDEAIKAKLPPPVTMYGEIDELDEYGMPIPTKNKAEVILDEFGMPIDKTNRKMKTKPEVKKKMKTEPGVATGITGADLKNVKLKPASERVLAPKPEDKQNIFDSMWYAITGRRPQIAGNDDEEEDEEEDEEKPSPSQVVVPNNVKVQTPSAADSPGVIKTQALIDRVARVSGIVTGAGAGAEDSGAGIGGMSPMARTLFTESERRVGEERARLLADGAGDRTVDVVATPDPIIPPSTPEDSGNDGDADDGSEERERYIAEEEAKADRTNDRIATGMGIDRANLTQEEALRLLQEGGRRAEAAERHREQARLATTDGFTLHGDTAEAVVPATTRSGTAFRTRD